MARRGDMNNSVQRLMATFLAMAGLTAIMILIGSPYLMPPEPVEPPSLTFVPIQKPVEVVDTLSRPLHVTRWTPRGLVLADGRVVHVPGFTRLPNQSAALTEAIRR